MITKIKNIECEFRGLIPSKIVSHYLFNDNEKKAIKYLNSLVENGVLKYLNGEYPENQFYRFIDDSYKTDCRICPEQKCIEPING